MEKVNDQTVPTAIVTGSTKGIGKATAQLLAKRGYNVVICSRNRGDIGKTVEEIMSEAKAKSISKNKSAPQVMGLKCDVCDTSDVDSLVKATMEMFGGIDVLVNNAGILLYKDLADTSKEEWIKTININLTGTFLFCKTVLPHMVKNNSGVIINVSSGAGKIGFPKLSAYCASKFGVMGLSESLAAEVNEYNIRVMTICPGEIDTQMINDAVNFGYRLHCKRNEMLKPVDVAQKILDMVTKTSVYRNAQCVEFYSGISQ
jgi:3-oxoacyl-[acyl-carrier protein] reductase